MRMFFFFSKGGNSSEEANHHPKVTSPWSKLTKRWSGTTLEPIHSLFYSYYSYYCYFLMGRSDSLRVLTDYLSAVLPELSV